MKRNAIQYGLLIALAGSCCAAAADPVRVDVAMVDYRFSPDHLSLVASITGCISKIAARSCTNLRRRRSSPRQSSTIRKRSIANTLKLSCSPAKARTFFLPRARPEPMICAAATMIGMAWWAASPSANARPLSAGRRSFNARKDSNCRKLRRETGGALARLRAGARRGEAADGHNERQTPENSR